MKIKIFLSILIVSLATSSLAKNITSKIGKVEDAYNFWLVEPDDYNQAKPVVIFLHGASLCGNDLNKVRRYGTIDAVEKGRDIDAFIIAPQNPGGSWKPEKIMNILNWVEENYNIDTDRVYVLGMSLGGYGTLDFTATYPDKVAAAIAMCGGATKKAEPLADVPLWIVHGTADKAVSVTQSDKVVEAIKSVDEATTRLHYDRIPGMNHSQPARVFYIPETYEWLFSHSLQDEGRPMAETFNLSKEIPNAYKGLKFTGSKRSKVSKSKSSAKKRSTNQSVKKRRKKK